MVTDLSETRPSSDIYPVFSGDERTVEQPQPEAKPIAKPDSLKFLTFNLGSKLYGISADLVEEISNPLPVTRLPGAPKGVLGIAPLRDEILAVIDLRGILREQSLTSSNRSKFIIARSDLAEMRIAIPVDRVREMVEISDAQSEVATTSDTLLIFGKILNKGSECQLLDPYKLWSVLWTDATA